MLLIATTLGLSTATAHTRRIPEKCAARPAPVLCAIHTHRRAANHLRARMGQHPIAYQWRAERYPARRPRILAYWLGVHTRTLRHWHAYQSAPWLHGSWYTDALCVHHYEGAWNADTGNGYYGGLQFDLSTWASNGGHGRPDLNPPREQLRVAYRTWQARGWTPWPSTARMCGLL